MSAWRRVAGLLVIGLTGAVPAAAEEPLSEPMPWLRSWFPTVRAEMDSLPPFFRDTRVNLHLRTFYLNRTSTTPANAATNNSEGTPESTTVAEALATGGWLEYRSGWLLDAFSVGAVGYLSEPLYAPSDRDGTQLLATGQEGYAALGQAWAALRYKEYALLKGPRQLVEQSYVNPHDTRMSPNTFEGATLSGEVGSLEYFAAFLSKEKPRNQDNFVWMTQQAGIVRHHDGLGVVTARATPWTGLVLYGSEFYLPDGFNTAYGEISYDVTVARDWRVELGFQYTDQRSVGAQLLGDFVTWNTGGQARLSYAGASVRAAFAFTGQANDIQTPWGRWPGYLHLQLKDFDLANQNAWGVGVGYDFAQIGVRGLTASAIYAMGTNAVKPNTDTALSNAREADFRADWVAPENVLRGFSFTFRGAAVNQNGQRLQTEFRLIMNYEIPLL
jgi:outer membrane porin, OprD family